MPRVEVHQHVPWAASWTVDEPMERASHALAHEGRVWLVDPVEDGGALAVAETLGEIAGVVQLLDRHPRDCAALAARFAVPHLRLPAAVEGSPFEVRRVIWLPRWRELALWWPARRALVVSESVGTASYFALGRRVGMHPFVRALPPPALRKVEPEHLLVGHGPPVHEDAAGALREALRRSQTDVPRVLLGSARAFLGRR